LVLVVLVRQMIHQMQQTGVILFLVLSLQLVVAKVEHFLQRKTVLLVVRVVVQRVLT
jgi:hypothetical protein